MGQYSGGAESWRDDRTAINSLTIRDYFARYIDLDDALVVLEESDWASQNTNDSPNDIKTVVQKNIV